MIYWNGCSFVQGAENEFHQQFPTLVGKHLILIGGEILKLVEVMIESGERLWTI